MNALTRSLALSLLFASAAYSQQTIRGKVIDPQNQPVAGLQVLLHAVTGNTGMQLDRDTTAADGTFTMRVDSVNADAIYFVAAMWNGKLYVGDMMKPPFPSNAGYVVQVGINPIEAGAPAASQPAPVAAAPESDRKAGIIVVIVSALAIATVLYFALRRRPPARRRWLLELARIDDEIEAGGANDALQQRRAELRERLRSPQGS